MHTRAPKAGDPLSSLPYATTKNKAQVITTLEGMRATRAGLASSITILIHLQPRNMHDVLLSFNVRVFHEGQDRNSGVQAHRLVAMGRKVDAKLSGLYSAASVRFD